MKLGDDKHRFSHDDFDTWLAHMDDALAAWMARLPPELRGKLDYSVESLDALEAWLLDRYPSSTAVLSDPDPLIYDGATRYIGQTYCKLAGARWWMDPKGQIMGGKVPLITDFRTPHTGNAPGSLATAAVSEHHGRRGGRISGILRKSLGRLSGESRQRMDFLLAANKKYKIQMPEEWDFRYWLRLMDRALDELMAELPPEVRDRLDYSPGSLDVLEAWLLDRYPDVTAARADTEVLTMDGVARYIGETFRRRAGGEWWFDLDGWTHNGLPQIKGMTKGMGADTGEGVPPVCPLALAREAIEQRRGDVLRTTLQASAPTRPGELPG